MANSKMLQLDPSIPVVTPDGEGEAIGWIDYSKDDNLLWVVFLKKNGECWIYPNQKVRAVPNASFGRMADHSVQDVVAEIAQRPNGINGSTGVAKKSPAIMPLPMRNGHAHPHGR